MPESASMTNRFLAGNFFHLEPIIAVGQQSPAYGYAATHTLSPIQRGKGS